DDLAPLAFGIHVRVHQNPQQSADQKEDAERMVSELLPQWIENIFWGAAAFGRPFFEEILGSDHCQHNARPVCNSVAEKGSKVGGGIGNTIKYDPHDEHSHGGNTQRMLVKKGPAG